jgi:malate dehydrogenase
MLKISKKRGAMDCIKCAITGALGSVGYNLTYFLAQGSVFGARQKISLHLLEVPEFAQNLEGLKMEVLDCAFPAVHEVVIGTDPYTLFEDIDCAFLVGAKPRGPGMERKDLLETNGHVFRDQGKALNTVAKKTVRVMVVGNPCNTNCLIALKNAPSLLPSQFASLSYLDELRARALLAEKLKVDSSEVSPVVVWGNHSATLVPDITHTTVGGKNVVSLVEEDWVYSSFIPAVRTRGSTIIKLRGKSSSASAAWAAAQAQRAFVSSGGDTGLISMGTYSHNNPYGIDDELVFSFPISMVNGGLSIDPTMKPNEKLWNEVLKSEKELIDERDAVRHLFS